MQERGLGKRARVTADDGLWKNNRGAGETVAAPCNAQRAIRSSVTGALEAPTHPTIVSSRGGGGTQTPRV